MEATLEAQPAEYATLIRHVGIAYLHRHLYLP
jgi:hypothetical protein